MYEHDFLVWSVIVTEVEPPNDVYRLNIEGNHKDVDIYFNDFSRNVLANNTFGVKLDINPGTFQLYTFPFNPFASFEFSPPILLVINSAWALHKSRIYVNGREFASYKFKLKVYKFINMDNNSVSYLGIEGQTFSMPCLARFDSDSTETEISWYHNNIQIKNG